MSRVAFGAAFAACVAVSTVALGADLSFKDTPNYEYAPAPIWTGFYFGVHAGGTWGNVDVSDTFDYNGDPHADNSVDTSGVIAGVQVGYNWQHGKFVYGVEADLGYLDLSGSKYVDLPNWSDSRNNNIGTTYSFSGGLYGDLTARLGYAMDNTLFYVKGGAAFLNVDSGSDYVGSNCSVNRTCGSKADPSTFNFDDSELVWGWTVGAGVEYALNSSLSLKVEYQHFEFDGVSSSYKGEDKFNCGGTCTSRLTGNSEATPTVDAVKVGLNYRLNGGDDEALK